MFFDVFSTIVARPVVLRTKVLQHFRIKKSRHYKFNLKKKLGDKLRKQWVLVNFNSDCYSRIHKTAKNKAFCCLGWNLKFGLPHFWSCTLCGFTIQRVIFGLVINIIFLYCFFRTYHIMSTTIKFPPDCKFWTWVWIG